MWQLFAKPHISIHAAREGGDVISIVLTPSEFISIHAAREGGDDVGKIDGKWGPFQSTPPVKAATVAGHTYTATSYDFNPRRP